MHSLRMPSGTIASVMSPNRYLTTGSLRIASTVPRGKRHVRKPETILASNFRTHLPTVVVVVVGLGVVVGF